MGIIQIIKVDNVNIADTPHKVAVKKLLSFEHATFVHIELKPGESLKRHITPVDVAFYVLEGEGIVEIGKEVENQNLPLIRETRNEYIESRTPHPQVFP